MARRAADQSTEDGLLDVTEATPTVDPGLSRRRDPGPESGGRDATARPEPADAEGHSETDLRSEPESGGRDGPAQSDTSPQVVPAPAAPTAPDGPARSDTGPAVVAAPGPPVPGSSMTAAPPDTGVRLPPGPPPPDSLHWVPPSSNASRNRVADGEAPTRPRREPRGPRVVQGRRSRRVVRRIDSWTVFKLSFLFYLCGGLILLIAGVALWNIAGAFDVITNVEKFVQKLFDLQSFKLQAKAILGYAAIGAGVLVLLGTGANVLMALLYNLISDVIGGVQVIVLEEYDAEARASSDRGRGRTGGGNDDRGTRRRDRPPVADPPLSP